MDELNEGATYLLQQKTRQIMERVSKSRYIELNKEKTNYIRILSNFSPWPMEDDL